MKVLASDFDGTLFFKGKFKEEDLKQIRAFQAQGHQFGLCTGRRWRASPERSGRACAAIS